MINILGLKDFHVVGISGDGGTADIGIQALSGAIDRRDRVIYVCYDKAKSVEGTSYIHVFALCPTGWGTPTDSAIDIGREVVDCGLWYLAEYEGRKMLSPCSKIT